MIFHCNDTGHHSHRPSRHIPLTSLAVLVATLVLAACGGSTSATIAPIVPSAAANQAPVASASVASNGQPVVTPTTAPAATVRAATPQLVPTVAPAAAATASKPTAALNANAGSAAGKVDPCALLTTADYLAVMGDAANDPVKKGLPAGVSTGIMRSSCEYKIASADKVEFVTVNVMQRDPSAPAQINMKTYWEGTRKAWDSTQSKVTPLPEIGPEVYLVVNPVLEQIGAGGGVHFYKGDVIFDVQAVTGKGTVDEQNAASTVAAKKLATIAFGRL